MSLQGVEWYIARGAGLTAFVVLTAAVALGLTLSSRLTSARWPAIVRQDLHRHLTMLSLWMLGLHVVMLIMDAEAQVSPTEVLLPFRTEYRPWATALGVLAMYTAAVVLVTTKLRGRIGYRPWRKLHGLAFVAYGAAFLHGVLAGTDTATSWAVALYLGSGLLVGSLIIARVRTGRNRLATATEGTPTSSAGRSWGA
jgi:predicted ferric reductase